MIICLIGLRHLSEKEKAIIMKTAKIIFTLVLTFLNVGCQTLAGNNNLTPTKVNAVSTTSVDIAITPSFSPTPERLTPTALPLISDNNTKEILESFVKGNGGCKLPCVMGLTPGLSENTELNAFINYFQDNTREAENRINDIDVWTYIKNEQGGMSLRFFEDNKSISIGLGYITDGGKVNRIFLSGESYQHLDGGVKKQFGNLNFNILLNQFTLAEILNLYGPPTQILIRPFPNDLGHPSPPAQYTFDFVLVYPENGFLIQYISERTQQGKYFVGCPTKPYSLNISTWSPKTPLNLVDAVEYFSNIDGISNQNISAFKLIEEVTSLNNAQFYEIFRNPNSNECVETHKELWP